VCIYDIYIYIYIYHVCLISTLQSFLLAEVSIRQYFESTINLHMPEQIKTKKLDNTKIIARQMIIRLFGYTNILLYVILNINLVKMLSLTLFE